MPASAKEFSIRQAKVRCGTQHCVLDADIDFGFRPAALDALRQGVPITVILRFRLHRLRAWWFDEEVAARKLRYELRYLPFPRLLRISNQVTDESRTYVSVESGLESLGTIRDLPLFESARIRPGAIYRAKLKAELDVEALPLPMRPVVYLNPGWYHSSGWYAWRFAR